MLSAEKLCQLEYVSAAHALTLDELDRAAKPMVISCAAYVGSVHLIDNMVFGIDLYGAGNPA
jgi:pantothenate synthetase